MELHSFQFKFTVTNKTIRVAYCSTAQRAPVLTPLPLKANNQVFGNGVTASAVTTKYPSPHLFIPNI